MSKIAIIQFPGTNCEYETLRAVKSVGLEADLVRWNTQPEHLASYAGFILPGGFSYQDRVRAGVVAAKLPIVNVIIEADKAGKPILGICNGCQILSEAGLIPNKGDNYSIEVALAPNTKEGESIGFICDWKYLRIENPEKNIFTKEFNPNDVLPIPINHGEGRFVLSKGVADLSITKAFYTDKTGSINQHYPINPNGTHDNIAALSNIKGNVFAIMPHPERAAFLKQVPFTIVHAITEEKREAFGKGEGAEQGPWSKLFLGLKHAVLKKQEEKNRVVS